MMKKKKLMILGAGPGQVPLIRKAGRMGIYVITVDYLPENIGHEFSDRYVNCSTVDCDCVLKSAMDLRIDGIITFASDVATSTVGYVAEACGLPGGYRSVSKIMSHKHLFRQFQLENGLDHPRFLVGRNWTGIAGKLDVLNPPIVFKPADTSGSRGMTRIDTIRIQACETAFRYARNYSRSGTVCVEELIEGEDVSGDGLMVNGNLHAVITCKFKRGFMPIGHAVPAAISRADQQRICREISDHCRALNYRTGPLDFDVRISDSRVTVLEMSPRLGGNGIPAIIEHGTGFDLTTAAIRFALGETVAVPEPLEVVTGCASWIFGSDRDGRFAESTSLNELKRKAPHVFDYAVHLRPGDRVSAFRHSGNALGYVLFDCPDQSKYSEIVSDLNRFLRIGIEEQDPVESKDIPR